MFVINVKVHKGFNVVQSIMPTNIDDENLSTILKNREYKIEVSKYC